MHRPDSTVPAGFALRHVPGPALEPGHELGLQASAISAEAAARRSRAYVPVLVSASASEPS